MEGAQAAFLPGGRRLHLHHGPIDLIVQAEGPGRSAALRRAAARFTTILQELVGELDVLRLPVTWQGVWKRLAAKSCENDLESVPHGVVARRMYAAVSPFAPQFITPMAAVAGAVADEVLRAMGTDGLKRAWVNNGGDVALFLAPGQCLRGAVADAPHGDLLILAASPVRGVASSGWRGRSHSLGIADTVTVLAASAARADAAATMIANAVDLPGHRAIVRVPARELAPDSDLGERLVTVDVGPLGADEIDAALGRGAEFAEICLKRGLIRAARLTLAGQSRVAGSPTSLTAFAKERCDA
ncbi:MAG: UPF0280 family protein [Jhaorihella sp.]